eukprot:m.225405 g.225405  ORF g.225405 m.225405 type:complete len:154 (+) comp11259_c0_seq1:41-502(+)
MKVAVLLLVALAGTVLAEDIARGWGSGITWRGLEAGLAEASASRKPFMVVIHKTWCGACKGLRPKFAESEEIAQLSADFVMINLQDDEEPSDPSFAPDGGYIPRILFGDADGTVNADIFNAGGNPRYKYYYSDAESIAKAMKTAATTLSKKDL